MGMLWDKWKILLGKWLYYGISWICYWENGLCNGISGI